MQFADGDPDFEILKETLGFTNVLARTTPVEINDTIPLSKPSIPEINKIFTNCHEYIYRSDRISQARGFEEFVKLIALKLRSDKAIRDEYPGVSFEKTFDYPSDKVTFSVRWIRSNESSAPSPIDSILFRQFMDEVEVEIARRVRKRFFDVDERIQLKPETIKGVVQRLERLFLFGIDADLNGRLFEEFLSATMRGKDLGQYFTPRTLVKMGVGLGQLRTNDVILDGCCGTGGFLIDALSDMWSKVNRNTSTSKQEKERLRRQIADEQIYGIDFGKGPNLAKIARLNMYLHGDGGSRIFNVDALDMQVRDHATDSPEERTENEELRNAGMEGRFDKVLTNPPFRKDYDRGQDEDARVMEQYEVAAAKNKVLAKLMFFEMYHHYLKPGGRLVSIIDDGFLSAPRYRWFRNMLRSLYLIRAVISLPGDAFQRSKARVKTSFIVLEKKTERQEEQPAIFMFGCRYVGNDDPSRRRRMPGDDALRANARNEVETVVSEFTAFLDGNGNDDYNVSAGKAEDRLDVKHCMMERGSMIESDLKLSDVAQLKVFPTEDVIDCSRHEERVRLLEIEYSGRTISGREIVPKTDTEYTMLNRVRTGDIVISNIAAHYGSTAIVTDECDGHVISSEYTVITARSGFDVRVIWAVLRSAEIRAEMLLSATGANRTRIEWSVIKDIPLPYPDDAITHNFIEHYDRSVRAIREATEEHYQAMTLLDESLNLNKNRAEYILDAFKPPK
ncbi:MAG: N-6 DNA methylase [Candidatus Poribacteria bacterium]|nr:N-6 DNA methylase [Candidatus Poribacteria bacterium]